MVGCDVKESTCPKMCSVLFIILSANGPRTYVRSMAFKPSLSAVFARDAELFKIPSTLFNIEIVVDVISTVSSIVLMPLSNFIKTTTTTPRIAAIKRVVIRGQIAQLTRATASHRVHSPECGRRLLSSSNRLASSPSAPVESATSTGR